MPAKSKMSKKRNYKGSYAGANTVSFKDMLLKKDILRAISECGFEHPSEVQQTAIPFAMVGQDMIVQAKSGMGKTAVFVIATLQQIDATEGEDAEIDTLVLCHSREMAFQIHKEFERLGKYVPEIKTAVIYGGVNFTEQKKAIEENMPHVLVGTPGRVQHFMNKGIISFKSLQRMILDECDDMLQDDSMRRQIQDIFKKAPFAKQMLMCSATISESAARVCRQISENAEEIFLDDSKLTLHGLQQHYVELAEDQKIKNLTSLLDRIDFNQMMIFVKSKKRATALNKILSEACFPSIFLHGGLKQEDRLDRYRKFKEFEARILITTNLCGRGVDMERVNVVINFDMPEKSNEYLHRVGRAGRFGTKGLAITFVNDESDKKTLAEIQDRFEVKVTTLPKNIDTASYTN